MDNQQRTKMVDSILEGMDNYLDTIIENLDKIKSQTTDLKTFLKRFPVGGSSLNGEDTRNEVGSPSEQSVDFEEEEVDSVIYVSDHKLQSTVMIAPSKDNVKSRLLSSQPTQRTSTPCIFCKQFHYSDLCPNVIEYEERQSIAKKRNICMICIHPTSKNHRCIQRKKCFYCEAKSHHCSLCYRTKNVWKKDAPIKNLNQMDRRTIVWDNK
ncbi:hypothetical protein CRE_17206 [Caenorhabditis remanei]|uniref:Uncharacterized protein n=1 Tax=Caenorhabditis remanei TaxID=31234 RepID=E3MA27_CAERE|nr:hypothetical protein CRE_17206 [Caenorhabditis remanei]